MDDNTTSDTTDVNTQQHGQAQSPVEESSTNINNEVDSQELDTQDEEQSDGNESQEEAPKKRSEAVPYERFAEVNEKAKEAELLRQQNDFYRQQLEAMRGTSQTNNQPTEDPDVVQAKQALRQLGFMTQEEVNARLDEERTKERALMTINEQVSNLKQKYAGRNLPEVNAKDLIEWYEGRGHFADINNIHPTLLEDIYQMKYRDDIMSHYSNVKPRPAPTAQSSASTPGKGISEDDFWNAPPDKTDDYWKALRTTVK